MLTNNFVGVVNPTYVTDFVSLELYMLHNSMTKNNKSKN